VPLSVGVGRRALWVLVTAWTVVSLGAPVAAADGSRTTARAATDQAAVDALNILLQEGWNGVAADMESNASRWLKQSLEGRIAQGHGSVSGLKWSFDLEIANVEPVVDFGKTPGFRSINPTGLTLGIPYRGTWKVGVRGTVRGHAKVKAGGTTLFAWSPSFDFGLVLPALGIPITVGIDSSNPFLPRMSSFGFDPAAKLLGEGFLKRLGINLHGSGGPGPQGQTVTGNANNVSLAVPGLSTSLSANLGIEFDPSRPVGGLDVAGGLESAQGNAQLKLHTAFEQARFRLHGALSVKLPRIRRQSVPFDVNFAVPIPSSDVINQLLLAVQGLGGGLPRRWGDDATLQHPTPPPPATADADLAKAADDLESIVPTHLPFDTILSIDTIPPARGPGQRPGSTPTLPANVTKYGLENDSAIWSGHYLAAEALRYAATKAQNPLDHAPLDRLKRVLGGIERLFWVTQDAALVPGGMQSRYTGHTSRGQGNFFARAAAPDHEAERFAEGSLATAHGCAYVRPEGGWKVTRGSNVKMVRTFDEATALAGSNAKTVGIPATAAHTAAGRPQQPTIKPQGPGTPGRMSPTIAPVGRVWYGLGCGEHPTSRDQVAGLSLGLAFAHELVDDPEVRTRTATLGSDMVRYLDAHGWEIKVPPSDTKGQNYWGGWDAVLSLLRLGATFDPGRFQAKYDAASAAIPIAWVPVWFGTLDPLSEYYKFNLGQATLASALLLEHNTARRAGYDYAYRVLSTPLLRHKNAYFSAVEIFNRPADQRAAAASEAAGSNPQISRADEIRSLLLSWERRRQLIEGPNRLPKNDIAHMDRLLALWPSNVGLYTTFDVKPHCFARYALAPEDRIGNGMDFMWQRHPFGTGAKPHHCTAAQRPGEAELRHDGAEATREGSGVDFLLPYWMSVYTGAVARPQG
jgi:hypothetical protein